MGTTNIGPFPNSDDFKAQQRQMWNSAAAVWSAPSKVPWPDLVFASVRKQVNDAAPPLGTPGPFDLADMENLKKWFSQKGFKDIKVETIQAIIHVIFEFDSPESFTRFHQQIIAPVHAMSEKYTDEVRRQAWNAVTEAVHQFLILMTE